MTQQSKNNINGGEKKQWIQERFLSHNGHCEKKKKIAFFITNVIYFQSPHELQLSAQPLLASEECVQKTLAHKEIGSSFPIL